MKSRISFLVIIKMFLMILLSSLIGLALLWIVYLLPTEPMAENIVDSKNTLYAQDDSGRFSELNWSEVLDTYTNTIMLYEVIYPIENPFQDSLLVPSVDFYSIDGSQFIPELLKCAEDFEYGSRERFTYARYWHGNLVLLKPLLLFMELKSIYILNAVVLCILVSITVFLLRKRLGNSWVAYFICILLMKPLSIAQSFQLSVIFYIIQIIMIALLSREKWKKEQYLYIFILDGILVSYFDFLTYPYVALAIPLLTCYFLDVEEGFVENCIDMLKRVISFFVGYIGLWGLKWIYASIFTSENVILDAINSVLHRIGALSNTSDVLATSKEIALSLNLMVFFNKENVVVIIVSFIIGIVCLALRKYKLSMDKHNVFFCGLIAVSPFIWIILLENHCSLHSHLEWRTLTVFAYAIATCFINSLVPEKRG